MKSNKTGFNNFSNEGYRVWLSSTNLLVANSRFLWISTITRNSTSSIYSVDSTKEFHGISSYVPWHHAFWMKTVFGTLVFTHFTCHTIFCIQNSCKISFYHSSTAVSSIAHRNRVLLSILWQPHIKANIITNVAQTFVKAWFGHFDDVLCCIIHWKIFIFHTFNQSCYLLCKLYKFDVELNFYLS